MAAGFSPESQTEQMEVFSRKINALSPDEGSWEDGYAPEKVFSLA